MVVKAYLFLVNKLDPKTPPQETIQAVAPQTGPQISNPPCTESRAMPQQAVAPPTTVSGHPPRPSPTHQMPTQL